MVYYYQKEQPDSIRPQVEIIIRGFGFLLFMLRRIIEPVFLMLERKSESSGGLVQTRITGSTRKVSLSVALGRVQELTFLTSFQVKLRTVELGGPPSSAIPFNRLTSSGTRGCDR